jgi:hypothetical protein
MDHVTPGFDADLLMNGCDVYPDRAYGYTQLDADLLHGLTG